jgi:prevent-host-death family protein
MKTVTTREAQHHLSKVLELVEAGEDVVITRRGREVAKLTAVKGDGDLGKGKVDWNEARKDIRKSLGHLPKLEGSSVEMMRELERY